MGLLRILMVTLVVWGALGSAADVTPTHVASLVLQRQVREVVQGPNDPQEPSQPSDTTTTTQAPQELPKPKVYKMHVESHIEYRFANTLISSRVGNPAKVSQEVYFSVTLPETAFISKFLMEVDDKVYEATVKEKEEAKQVYDQAVASGQGAAHVAVSARDSNRFTVSVNIEPAKKVNFNLTYEELLTRRLGAYNHVINLDPGQIVGDLRVDVYIKENKNITVLRVPELRSGNEVDADETTKANSLATIERKSAKEAHISFSPTEEQQKALGRVKGLDEDNLGGSVVTEGLGGQFVVQYDVDRDDKAGEVLVNNGYFVHFFAPKDLPPLRKHALFVLDVSGSMSGRKIEQLKDAMNAILDDLNEGDYFNIIEFSYSVTVWNLDATASSAVFSSSSDYHYGDEPAARDGPTPAFPATPEYIEKAKEIVKKMRAGGGTNIYDTLKTVIRVAHDGLQNITTNDTSEEKLNPIIVFLTDGEPTVGETRLDKIFSIVKELNSNPEASIFSLAFGDDADLEFLKKLSLKNSGFARKIYEASDAALQLRDFYRQVASPLLANVTFEYQPEKIVQGATTKTHFHTLFSGSEIIVAGKFRPGTDDKITDETIEGHISGFSQTGDSIYPITQPWPVMPTIRPADHTPVTSLERLWAYLTIKQLLESDDTKSADDTPVKVADDTSVKVDNDTTTANSTIKDPKKEALKLALQYSFVTKLTSLVVVKPNATTQTEAGSIQPVDRIGTHAYPGSPLYISGTRPAFGPGGPAGGFGGGSAFLQSAPYAPPRSPPRPVSLNYPASAGFSGAGGFYAPTTTFRPSYPGSAGPPRYPGYPGQPGLPGRPGQPLTIDSADISPVLESLPQEEAFELEDETTTPPPPPTTVIATDVTHGSTTVLPQQVPALISLEDLEWLEAASNGSDVITLPFDDLGGNKTYHLERNNQTTGNLDECKTPTGLEGQCRHLSQCSLSVFQHDVQEYKGYFCAIRNFAGACCPKSLFPQEAATHDHGVTASSTSASE